MAQSFRFRLFGQHDLSDAGTLSELWQLLADSPVSAQRFDSVERTRREFRIHAVDEAATLFARDLHLFVRGGRDSFLAVFTEPRRRLSVWDFWLDAGALGTAADNPWLRFVFEVCTRLPTLYGFGCSVPEYEAKHARVREAEGGGVVRGAYGASIPEFFRYLPGIYWLTIFGRELVEAFGGKLANLQSVETRAIGSGQVAVRIEGPPVPTDMRGRVEAEGQLAEVLGPEFFFDRNRSTDDLRPVPELARVLTEGRSP